MEDITNTPQQPPDHTDVFFDAAQNQPNTGKKRYKPSDFYRVDVTPSRVNRIKEIFEDAAALLQSSPSIAARSSRRVDDFASPTWKSDRRVVRLSAHKADSDYFVYSSAVFDQPSLPLPHLPYSHGQSDTRLKQVFTPLQNSKEPLSSGHKTPSRIPRPLRSPTRIACNAGSTYGANSDDEDVHSTHKVPLVMPIHNTEPNPSLVAEKVFTWLNSMEGTVIEGKAKRPTKAIKIPSRRPVRNRNYKENIPPSRRPDAAKSERQTHRPLIPRTTPTFDTSDQVPLQFPIYPAHHTLDPKQIPGDIDTSKSTPPTGLLLLPPRRMGLTPDMPGTSKIPKKPNNSEPRIPKTRTLHHHIENLSQVSKPALNSGDYVGILPLSPSVTRYRRGRGVGSGHDRCNRRKKEDDDLEYAFLDDDLEFARGLQEEEDLDEYQGRRMH